MSKCSSKCAIDRRIRRPSHARARLERLLGMHIIAQSCASYASVLWWAGVIQYKSQCPSPPPPTAPAEARLAVGRDVQHDALVGCCGACWKRRSNLPACSTTTFLAPVLFDPVARAGRSVAYLGVGLRLCGSTFARWGLQHGQKLSNVRVQRVTAKTYPNQMSFAVLQCNSHTANHNSGKTVI